MKPARITGNLKKISRNRTLKRLGLPEEECSGINAKPVTAPSPKHAGRSSTANAPPNTKFWKRWHC